MAFDDAVAILHPLPGGLELSGAVDGRHLCSLLEKLTADAVDLIAADGKISLRAGRTRASFDAPPVTLPIDSVDLTGEMVDFPATFGENGDRVGFADQLKWVSACCARDMSRPALTCVLVEGDWMQATDGYRAARIRHGCVGLPRLMLPIDQVEVLVDYPIRRVALSEGREWARFESDASTVLCCRSMSGALPDVEYVYDVAGCEIQLTAALAPVLERAMIFSKRANAADEEVAVSMQPNRITVSAQYDGGRFSEVVRCDGISEEVEFVIHPKFLAAALESGTGCVLGKESIKFSGKDWEHVISLKGS